MTSQGRIEQAEIWKELLLKLPGIVSAEFVFGEEDSVRELHVLSTEKRTPKQIVRDIESAMMAKFGVQIDHRLISVAQISEDAVRDRLPVEKRLVCSGMDLSMRRSVWNSPMVKPCTAERSRRALKVLLAVVLRQRQLSQR